MLTPQAFLQLSRNPQFLDQLAESPIDPNAILRLPFQAPTGLGLNPQGGGLGLQLPTPETPPGGVGLQVPGLPAPTATARPKPDAWSALGALGQIQQQQQTPAAEPEMLRYGAAQPAKPQPYATGPGGRRRSGGLGEILAGFRNA